MTYKECLEYIHSFDKFGSKPGFERINRLLSELGNPEKHIKCFHIAGTNGKGSVSLMLQNILTISGKKCGLFISPYVVDFRERMQIDGEYISKDTLCRYIEKIKSIIDNTPEEFTPTEFELITAVMFCWFYDEKVDCAVLEVGLGGRLDATNVIAAPIVSVITKIDLDHTGILGDTLSKIAAEKCGIIKQDCPTVTSGMQSNEALKTIKKIASERNSELTVTNSCGIVPKVTKEGTFAMVDGIEVHSLMLGNHQADNMSVAVAAIKTSGLDIADDVIQKGITSAVMPARTEIISLKPFVMLDGSHNPAGAKALAVTLDQIGIKNATAIVGMMKDKDVDEVVDVLVPKFNNVITVTVGSNPRAISGEELVEKCKGKCKNVFAAPDYPSAISLASTLSEDNPIIVFGSLYLAGDIRPLLLDFFESTTK
ncbi:MAG: bifunctional folylpolyglutamate synthase/dihydrofolate synthase [Clostridia bacterium]|nr:bifunctional folylpolyglutamate synthase/dihydrofolate synthase [Clostridia bacterium]